MPYTTTTWQDMVNTLQARMDKQGVFFQNSGAYPELLLYLKEALRVWNVLSNHYRARVTFQTTAGQGWYDLLSVTTNPLGILTPKLTTQDLIAEMEYHLMEPVSVPLWGGSDMFTMSDLTGLAQFRRDQFRMQTGIVQSHIQRSLAIPSEGRFSMPQNTVDIRRMSWLDTANKYNRMWRSDEWTANSNKYKWNLKPATPIEWSILTSAPLVVQLIPPPEHDGRLDLFTVDVGNSFDSIPGLPIGIPDEFAWAVKWGTLADLLSLENQARDPDRAAYCDKRFSQGAEIANITPIIMGAWVNNVNVPLASLAEMDGHDPNWENKSGKPAMAACSRYNIALSPVPDGAYGITVDILKPAPMPNQLTDYIQLGVEEIGVILDYAQHIASFKEGGVEFHATDRQFNDMIQLASIHNERLNASSVFREVIEDQSDREEKRRLRREVLYNDSTQGK